MDGRDLPLVHTVTGSLFLKVTLRLMSRSASRLVRGLPSTASFSFLPQPQEISQS